MWPATCDFCVQTVPASPAKMLVGEPPQTPNFGPTWPEVNAPIRGRLRVLRTLIPGTARRDSTGREPRQEQAALRRCFALLTRPPARAGGLSRGKPYTGFPSGKATFRPGLFSPSLDDRGEAREDFPHSVPQLVGVPLDCLQILRAYVARFVGADG